MTTVASLVTISSTLINPVPDKLPFVHSMLKTANPD